MMKVNLGAITLFHAPRDFAISLGRKASPFVSGLYFVDEIMGSDGQLSFLARQSEFFWAYSQLLFINTEARIGLLRCIL